MPPIPGAPPPVGRPDGGPADKVGTGGSTDGLPNVAGQVTSPVALIGVILPIFVRGRAGGTDGAGATGGTPPPP